VVNNIYHNYGQNISQRTIMLHRSHYWSRI